MAKAIFLGTRRDAPVVGSRLYWDSSDGELQLESNGLL